MLLALDTATENCSAALEKDGKIFSVSEVAQQKHAAIILPMIDSLLSCAQAKREDLQGIVFGRGPGSFTGVRIGTSIAQGLSLGLNIKALGVSDLKALAFEAIGEKEGKVVASIDARMGEVYFCIYEKKGVDLIELCEEQVIKPETAVSLCKEKAPDAVYAGTGVAILKDHGLDLNTQVSVLYPDAKAMLKLGALSFSSAACDPAEALPVYLRNEVTWKKVSEQKLKV